MFKNIKIISYSCIPLVTVWLAFIILSILAPFFEAHYLIPQSNFCYVFLGRFCSQTPTHCIWVFGSNMGLDCRCFFIYIFLFLTGCSFIVRNSKILYVKISIALLIPVVLDGVTQYLHYRSSTNALRMITGALCGVGLGMLIYPTYARAVEFILSSFLKITRGGDLTDLKITQKLIRNER